MMKFSAPLLVLLALLVVASTSAFTTTSRPFVARTTTTTNTARFMFSKDDKKAAASPLVEVSAEEASTSSSSEPEITSVYRDLNTGEEKQVKWVDPAMSANTDLGNLGWAYVFLIFPALLLLNDAFHFIPPNSPISFLTKY